MVREDSLTLYGFSAPAERDMFEVVQTVSGVGPRLALAMLAVMGPTQLAVALSSGDTKALTTIPGIGAKWAERLVLELRDKVGAVRGGGASAGRRHLHRPRRPRAVARPGHRGARRPRLVGQAGRGCRGARRRSAPADADVAAYLRPALRELGP